MNVLIGYQPAAIWVIPQHFVDRLRAISAAQCSGWVTATIRRLLPEPTSVHACVESRRLPSATDFDGAEPGGGCGSLMFPGCSRAMSSSQRTRNRRGHRRAVLGVTIGSAGHLPGPSARRRPLLGERSSKVRPPFGRSGDAHGLHRLGAIGGEVARIAAPFGFVVSHPGRRVDQRVRRASRSGRPTSLDLLAGGTSLS